MNRQGLVETVNREHLTAMRLSEAEGVSTAPDMIGYCFRNNKWVTYKTDGDGAYHFIKKCPTEESACEAVLYELRLAKKKTGNAEKTACLKKLDDLKTKAGKWAIVVNAYSPSDYVMGYYFNKDAHTFAVYKNDPDRKTMKPVSDENTALKELITFAETEAKQGRSA